MKKLFLLIIASWATSCLPAPDTESSSAQAQTKKTFSLQKFNEITRENQTLTKTNNEFEKKDTLKNNFDRGVLSAIVGMAVTTGLIACDVVSDSMPLAALGLGGAVVVCSLIQEWASEDDKNKTTAKERAFAHVKGIGSVAFLEVLAFGPLAAKMYSDNKKALKTEDKWRRGTPDWR